MQQTEQQHPILVQIVPRNFWKEVHEELVASGGYNASATRPAKKWMVYALKEKAIKRGSHVYLNSERKAFVCDDEQTLLEWLIKPASEGGGGYYKVIYYCDADSTKEVYNFNNMVTLFKLQFRSDTPGNIEI